MPVSRRAPRFLTAALLLTLLGSSFATAQEWILNNKHHNWARFRPGSWKRVRVSTDKLGPDGKVLSMTTTDSITTLVDVNENSYTLMVDSEVEMGSSVYRGRPKFIKRFFRNQKNGSNGSIVSEDLLRTEDVVVDDAHKIRSEVRQIVFTKDQWRRTTTVHYASTQPFILKRVTKSQAPTGQVGYETQVKATKVDALRQVLGEPRRVHQLEIVHRQGKLTTETEETHCPDVPGGVISHRLTQKTTDDKVVNRSRLELIDYHVSTGKGLRRGRRGLLPRRTRPLRRRNR